MADDFSDLHDELRSVASDLLGKEHGSEIGSPLLARAGWTGLEVSEGLGGAGATFREVAIICEEMGRAAADSRYLGGVVLSIGLLNTLEPGPVRDTLLSDIAAGAASVAVAFSAEFGPGMADTPFTIEQTATGLHLYGSAGFVPDAEGADWILVPALDPTGLQVMAAVPAHSAGLLITGQPLVDESRRFAAVSADGVEVAESALLSYIDPAESTVALGDRAAVAVALDSLGISEAMLAATVSYTAVREQFGRAIGSFQAVKHACADMQVQIAVSRQLVRAAVDAVAEGADASRAASMAKAYVSDAAVAVAGKAMQLHGGIGYTWESGIHVYLKRATLNRSLFGSPAAHRLYLTRERARMYGSTP